MDRQAKAAGHLALMLAVIGVAAQGRAMVPVDSMIGQSEGKLQRVLISACEGAESITKQSFAMNELGVGPAGAGVEPKFGSGALKFTGNALQGGGKGDFVVPTGAVKRPIKTVGSWMYVAPDANVETVGFQLIDGTGENLFVRVPVSWQGWKWIEADLTREMEQAWPQNGNKQFDQPLRALSVIWFAKAAGPTTLLVDEIVAAVAPEAGTGRISLMWRSAVPGRT